MLSNWPIRYKLLVQLGLLVAIFAALSTVIRGPSGRGAGRGGAGRSAGCSLWTRRRPPGAGMMMVRSRSSGSESKSAKGSFSDISVTA